MSKRRPRSRVRAAGSTLSVFGAAEGMDVALSGDDAAAPAAESLPAHPAPHVQIRTMRRAPALARADVFGISANLG